MNLYKRLASLLLLLSLSLPAVALNLNEAMSALGDAKASGQLGEMPNGYLGVVSNGGQAAQIAQLINQARRAEVIGGRVELESTPRGTRFTLLLPIEGTRSPPR